MKRLIIGVLLGLVLAVAVSYYSKASEVRKLLETTFMPVRITNTMFEGERVVNFNLEIPSTLFKSSGKFCFAVTDEENFLLLSMEGSNLVLDEILGGNRTSISKFELPALNIVTVMVRGPLCGISTPDGIAGLYIGNENIPPVWSWLNASSAEINFNPLSSVFFADSFMRASSDGGDWNQASGSWKIVSLPNPSRSANAFRLLGEAPDDKAGLNILDLPDWDNYRAEVNLRPKSRAGSGGFVFDYKDDNNFNAVLLDASEPRGRIYLMHKEGDKVTVLAEHEGGFSPEQWYHLELRQTFGRIVLFLGETEIFQLSSPFFSSGKFGLVVSEYGKLEFDDLDVRSLTPSETASLLPSSNSWHKFGDVAATNGSFNFYEQRDGMAFLPLRLGEGSIIKGKLSWQAGASGAVFLQGISSSGETVVALPSYRLVTTAQYLSDQSMKTNSAPGSCEYEIKVEKGRAFVSFLGSGVYRDVVPLYNGVLVFGVGGRSGFTSNSCKVDSSAPGKVMLWKNEIFTYEETMRNWNDDTLHWKRNLDKREAGFYFVNERVFSRKLEASLNIGEANTSLPKYIVTLSFPLNVGDFASGYVYMLEKDGETYTAKLSFGSEEIWSIPYEGGDKVFSIGLYRDGNYLLCMINNMLFRTYVHPEEISFTMVGYGTSPFYGKPDSLEVNSDSTYEYLFNTAPSDWQVGGGIWEVVNRWQCDPRWSWFSGDSVKSASAKTSKLAMLWWRHKIEGDFTFEMYFGFKMDKARGDKYSYARDVNVSLASDTSDLLSGYNFIIGGAIGKRPNAGSWVQRGAEKIPYSDTAKTDVSRYIIDAKNSHRFWHHYMLTRRGNRFTVEFTDTNRTQTLFDFTDNDPLDVNRLGIWTYECGLMLSRIRIQTTGAAEQVDPSTESGSTPRTIYDIKDM